MSVKNPTSHRQELATLSIGDFTLESGDVIKDVELAYERYGPTNAPVILICHALTGSQHTIGSDHSPGWWAGLVGDGCPLDTNHYQVITFNVLGGCHGSTGPTTPNPDTGNAYRLDFPEITVRDIVHSQHQALQQLDIQHVQAVAGASLGGMQTLEWGLLYPQFMDQLYVLAATPYLSDYGIAFNHIGTRAIQDDPNFQQGNYVSNDHLHGFEVARMTGMVTYRSGTLFQKRFNREQQDSSTYEVQSYLDYQGVKIKDRFDANSYLYLLTAMNHHNIGRGREGWTQAAKQYQAKLYTISFQHDLLYPYDMMKSFSDHAHDGEHYHVETDYGHDGFLVEFDEWGSWIGERLNNNRRD